jgi:hypothetical protein
MSKTLAQLRTLVRSRADAEGDDHKSDTEINAWINQAGAALHDIKLASQEDYALLSTTFTLTTANTSSLPAAFYNLKGLDYQDGDRWLRVKQFNFAERDLYREDTGFDGTYRLWYNPTFTELAVDADFVEDRDSEFIVAHAARKCLAKEESDTRDVDAEIAMLTQRITSTRAKRDYSGPRHVAEVRRERVDLWHDPDASHALMTSRAYRLLASTIMVVSRSMYPVR